jgi:hypothetical protein
MTAVQSLSGSEVAERLFIPALTALTEHSVCKLQLLLTKASYLPRRAYVACVQRG